MTKPVNAWLETRGALGADRGHRLDRVAARPAHRRAQIAQLATPALQLSAAFDWFRSSSAKLAKSGSRTDHAQRCLTEAGDIVDSVLFDLQVAAERCDALILEARGSARGKAGQPATSN